MARAGRVIGLKSMKLGDRGDSANCHTDQLSSGAGRAIPATIKK